MDLPGPQFVTRPGWGGQLRHACRQAGQWLSRTAFAFVFRIVVLVVLILVGRSLLMRSPELTPSPTPALSPAYRQAGPLTLHASAGDGMTNIAARALDLYLALQSENVRLDAAQHLFAVDALARSACWCPVELGQAITFYPLTISSIINRALNLSSAQHAAWQRLLQ